MVMIYIFSDRPSRSANVLKHAIRDLGFKARRLYSPIAPKIPGTIVNWGSPRWPREDIGWPVLNMGTLVETCISKVKSLETLEKAGVPCIKITKDKEVATKWSMLKPVLMRRDGLSSGKGIQPFNSNLELPLGSFYSRVFPKTHEFRVHVVKGVAVDLVQKKNSRDNLGEDRLIRTHENGWVFAHEGIILNEEDKTTVEQLAISACKALGADFGAVDILGIMLRSGDAPRRLSRAVVCEVNTKPGLENTKTIQAYARALVENHKRGKMAI